jgi:hypothetical protein
MKIVIWNNEEANTLKVKLTTSERGGVKLVSVDEDGDEEWNLLGINAEGKLYLYEGVGEGTGLCLDKNDCIKIDKETL